MKSSVTKNHGIDPGPVANPTTKVMTMTIEMYFNTGAASCKENLYYFWIKQALSNQIFLVTFTNTQLTQASFLQKYQTLQFVFLIVVMLRWHRASVACKNQSFLT